MRQVLLGYNTSNCPPKPLESVNKVNGNAKNFAMNFIKSRSLIFLTCHFNRWKCGHIYYHFQMLSHFQFWSVLTRSQAHVVVIRHVSGIILIPKITSSLKIIIKNCISDVWIFFKFFEHFNDFTLKLPVWRRHWLNFTCVLREWRLLDTAIVKQFWKKSRWHLFKMRIEDLSTCWQRALYNRNTLSMDDLKNGARLETYTVKDMVISINTFT